MGVQQSAGPVSVHCEGVEGANFPSVSLVTGVGEVGWRLQLMGHIHTVGLGWRIGLPLTQLYCHKTQHQSPQPCHVH